VQELKPKILVIDDEKALREGIKSFLENESFYVEIAKNGLSGIELALKNDFDIIMIDMKLPDIEGYEVLKKIKESKPNSICIVSTAFASIEAAVSSVRLGAFSYIPKPFSPDELLFQLEQGIKQRKILVESELLRNEKEEFLLEIANEKSRLNTIIESISSGVLLINKIGELVYFNHAALNKLNWKSIQIGEYILERLPDELKNILKDFLNAETIINKSITTQIEIVTKGVMFLDATCSAVLHSDGSFAGVVIILKNITGFKKNEFIKNQFISMVAHELKSPVLAALGFLQLMQDEKIKITKEQEVDFFNRSVQRLKGALELINDLLDISRMEMKKKYREIVCVNINKIISNIIPIFELEISKKNIHLALQLGDNIPEINLDTSEISRMFMNLMSNAIKYNRNGGYINIFTKLESNYILIKIMDTGIGLKEEDKGLLFNEFFRAKNKLTKNISGTGLGLTIVKRIVESYQGKIELESEFEKGTTFIIWLPINNSSKNG